MTASSRLDRIGQHLFRYRSWFPPVLVAVLIAAVRRPGSPTAGLDPRYAGAGLLIAAIGMVVRAAVIGTAPSGTSGRNTLGQVAQVLNTSGLYSVVRHPLYLGNWFLWLGLAVATGRWWAPVVLTVAFCLFYAPIIATEERFLAERFGAPYLAWASATPALVPNPARWRPPDLTVSFKIVARQEYYGLFTTVLFFVVLEVAAHWMNTGSFGIGLAWVALLAVVTVLSGTCRFLQRHTTLLDVPGR